ncbi:MAG: helix-turn-helix domain-containing protein [Actinomycetota bacterium]
MEWKLIKIARRQQDLSQRELARRASTSQAAIAAYESGRRSPTVDTLARIVRATGLDLRIRLAEKDDHDQWLAKYEASLPPEVAEETRRLDDELIRRSGENRIVSEPRPYSKAALPGGSRRAYSVSVAKAERPRPTPFERLEEAAKRIFSVSKKDLEKAELRKRKEKEAREADRSK